MQVCVGWYRFIADFGDFWSCYRVKGNRRVRDLERWASHFHDSLLDLDVRLDYLPGVVEAGRATLEDTVFFVARHVSRCKSLYLVADDDAALPLFVASWFMADGTNLQTLSLRRLSTVLNTHGRYPFPPIFQHFALPALRVLRLREVSFSWTHLNIFRKLTTLVLFNLRGRLSPTCHQMRMILGSASELTHVSLRHVVCVGPTDLIFPFSLPHLTDLDLCGRGDPGLAFVLRSCTLPLLETLSVQFESRLDIDHLLAIGTHM
ncbi:hypothetical protein DFH06DRAFT_1324034 [Mycena polygramma]|nr:hypothetical protein DFH06DRAFT_1324034 [Mycena polygramma]